jgi:serine/threonine-protein kinase
MAAVYAASHRNGAEGAIKILHAAFARRADARSRFLREAYIANKIGTGAVRVLDDDVDDDGAPYLVMDLLRGEPVEVRAKRLGGKLPLAEVAWIARELLTTLEHAHGQGIVHRDLKPDNLFWTTDHTLKVLDFGVARLRDANTTEMTATGVVLGTPMFMAPEQALGSVSEIDGRSDLWSLGAIMFRLLTGRHVHPAGEMNPLVVAATKRAPPIASVESSVPPAIADVIDKALLFDKEQRYESASAMRDALEKALGQKPAEVVPSTPLMDSRLPPPLTPEDSDSGLATGMSHGDSIALHKILRLIEDTLKSRAEDGPGAPVTIRKMDVAYRQATASLQAAHIGLFWNVVTEGFVARGQFVWVPKGLSRKAPGLMHAGGVRMIGLLPGLTKSEFSDVVRLIGCELAPFNDFASFLHSRQLEHVIHRIDPTRPGMPEHESVSIEPSTAAGVAVMLGALRDDDDGALRVTLLSRLERWGEGHEAELGAVLETAGVDVAIGLLRVLHVLGTPAAREALEHATSHVHPIVRIMALSHLDASERLWGEVDAILETSDPHARFDALVCIEKYKIVAAASALGARIRSGEFDTLPPEERRQALSALGAIDPPRAVAVAVEILRDDADPFTHGVAVELLGSIGESSAAREALEAARDRAEGAARDAAEAALASLDARASEAP